jgi:hypothetical protein
MPITPRERLARVLGGSKAPDPFSAQLTVPARDVRLTVTARDRSVSRSGRRRLRLRHEITCPPLSTNAIIHRHPDHLIITADRMVERASAVTEQLAGHCHALHWGQNIPFCAPLAATWAAGSGRCKPTPGGGGRSSTSAACCNVGSRQRLQRACWPTSPLRRRACCCNVGGGQERPLLGRSRSPGPLVTRSSQGREVCGSHDRQPAVPVRDAACGPPPGDSQYRPAMPRRLGQPSKARDPYRTAAARRIADACPGRYQRPWITVPLCSVTTFLALPVQSMKAGRSCQVSRASLQCSTTPAGDA